MIVVREESTGLLEVQENSPGTNSPGEIDPFDSSPYRIMKNDVLRFVTKTHAVIAIEIIYLLVPPMNLRRLRRSVYVFCLSVCLSVCLYVCVIYMYVYIYVLHLRVSLTINIYIPSKHFEALLSLFTISFLFLITFSLSDISYEATMSTIITH